VLELPTGTFAIFNCSVIYALSILFISLPATTCAATVQVDYLVHSYVYLQTSLASFLCPSRIGYIVPKQIIVMSGSIFFKSVGS